MLLNCGVHRIWSKVQFAGPRHSAVFQRNLRKQTRIGQRCKYSGLRRMNQARQIDRPRETVGKCNPQPKTWKGLYFGYTPGRPGHYLLG